MVATVPTAMAVVAMVVVVMVVVRGGEEGR